MSYSAFIFDFDYTLGDSTKGIVDSINYAFREMGLPKHKTHDIRKTVGMTMPNAFTFLTGNTDNTLSETFYRLFMIKANEVMTDNTVLFQGTIPVLSALKAKGLKTGIVTTKYHRRIDAILAKYEIAGLVDTIVGIDDVKYPKPDPEALFKAAKLLGVHTEDILYTGDSIIDAEAAKEAKIDFLGVTTGTTSKAEFSDYPNIAVVDSLSELEFYIMEF